MASRLPTRLALALALAFSAACSDDDDPTGPDDAMTLEEVVAQCDVGSIGVVGTTDVVETGTVDDSDCYIGEFATTYEGRIEGYNFPQASFGTWDAVDIAVQADFDAVIVVIDENGDLVHFQDDDEGGDFGNEFYTLFFDQQTGSPDYFIGVMSYGGVEGEEGGYTISFSGTDGVLAVAK